MKSYFEHDLSKDSWLITEKEWDKNRQHARETQFTQGNGYLGIRGILEEVPRDSCPGTFIAGLYDRIAAQETEIVNLPNPIHFKITVNGEKLGLSAMETVRHRRHLDMRNGLIVRQTVFTDSRKRKFDYQSVRFVSMHDHRIVAFRVYLTPLDGSAEITVKTDVDVSTANSGVLTEGHKRHFQLVQVYQTDDCNYVCVKTLERNISVAFASHLAYQVGRKNAVTTSEHAFQVKMKRRETVCFTKIMSIATSGDRFPGAVEQKALKCLNKATKQGFDKLLNQHVSVMHKKWHKADVVVKGDAEVQRALRFNIYHLLICGPEGKGEASIGAKTLSGEGYRGHIFWDTEIFLLPFFLFTQPSVARNMLLYRYYRLDAARKNARENGYRGAQFPWESADTGEEATPSWAKDFDGRIIQVKTGQLEHHIVSDIAYAVKYYYGATGDEDFMVRYGYELMFETARFWASRVHWNKKTKDYSIRHVIGPDEFHEDVHDNAYTNMMAKWTLLTAERMHRDFRRSHSFSLTVLERRLKLKPDEISSWRKIAARIRILKRDDGVMEQFAGFFKRSRVRSPELDENGLPAIPVGLDLSKIGKTQYIKQSDVVMLMYLLGTHYARHAKEVNYNYYVTRTLHKSSLSPAVHAIIGNEAGDRERAYRFFRAALYADLKDVHKNAGSGMHAASLGGVWQAAVNGFGGLRLARNKITIHPRLPKPWRELCFTVRWHGIEIHVRTGHQKVCLRVCTKKRGLSVPVRVYGRHYELRNNRPVTFSSGASGKTNRRVRPKKKKK